MDYRTLNRGCAQPLSVLRAVVVETQFSCTSHALLLLGVVFAMELLIQSVQDHPVLYDSSHEDYMRGKLKDEIWDTIAKELNYTSGQMAKTQWRKLRDCFRDALRRQGKKRSGQGSSAVRPWVYQKQMEFLIPHMINRNTLSNMSGAESATCIEAEVDEAVDDNLQEVNTTVDSVTDQQNLDISEECSAKQKQKKLKTSNLNEAMMKSIQNYEKRAEMRDDLRKAIAEKKPSEPNDPLYQFFMAMYKTTKNMPLTYQLRVKRKVFATVSEAEEEIITSQEGPGTSPWIVTSRPSSSASSGQDSSSLSTYWTDFGNTFNTGME